MLRVDQAIQDGHKALCYWLIKIQDGHKALCYWLIS